MLHGAVAALLLPLLLVTLASFAAAGSASSWEAIADGIPELDQVEEALHKVASAKLGPKQAEAARRAVKDVEQVLADVTSDSKLTKMEKSAKVQSAIRELQALQAQWQLAAVEMDLKKVVESPALASHEMSNAKKVVVDVESALDDIESGKLDAKARSQKVATSIQKLQKLTDDLYKLTRTSKKADLERKIAEKKAMLLKDEKYLKFASLEKELIEKRIALQKLVSAKKAAEEQEKERQDSAADQEKVSKLLIAAKALAVGRASPKEATVVAASAPTANASTDSHEASAKERLVNTTAIQGILTDLRAREAKAAASLAKMDADFHQREEKMKRGIEAGRIAPKNVQTDALTRGRQMMQMLLKREHRVYLKTRAVRSSELDELRSGIKSIESGDVAALTALMKKMQHESKLMEAKSKNFLH